MQKKVSFYSEGFKIAGTLYIPDDLAKREKRSAIVMCHGAFSNYTNVGILVPFYHYFCEKGYIVLQWDYRGFGDSEGPKWRAIPMEQARDASNAITFLQQQPEIDRNNIGLFGTSLGGPVVIYAAAQDKRAKCVVASVSTGNGRKRFIYLLREWERQKFLEELEEDKVRRVLTGKSKFVNSLDLFAIDPETRPHIEQTMKEQPDAFAPEQSLETAQAVLELAPDEVVHKIAPRPILFIVAEKDVLTPPELTREVYDNAGEPKKWVCVLGVSHFVYQLPWRQIVLDESFAWFNQYMPPVVKSKPSAVSYE